VQPQPPCRQALGASPTAFGSFPAVQRLSSRARA
jgi:hypothetical protein